MPDPPHGAGRARTLASSNHFVASTVVPGAVALRPSNTRAGTLVYPDKAAALALPGMGPNRLVRWAGAPGQPLSEQARSREAGNAQMAGCSGLVLLGAKAVGLARSRRSPGPARGTPQPTGSLQDHHRVTFAPRKCEVGPAPTALTCYRIMRSAADDCAM